jgi:cellulose synthase/poly-beta-1,6-N-acetylglucosamine synthase-like glycosyltransferase
MTLSNHKSPATLGPITEPTSVSQRKPTHWRQRRDWPRISLVTAVYNGEEYLEATIRSILAQGYPNLEYIVVNNGSTDGTAEIIRQYEHEISCWIDEPNQGLYAGLNAGFARCSGEIMGWLNASDMLHTNGLLVVSSVFRDFPEVEWITGHPTHFSSQGMSLGVRRLPRWSRLRFLAGANKYIQQRSPRFGGGGSGNAQELRSARNSGPKEISSCRCGFFDPRSCIRWMR